ncbi:Sec-independent protein translocase protein TatB [Daeguia caeni]|uniref:Sec-independent protein translocase protein TatB n=1 Tax=Daeguia caeni TaxID=439612 RepID=A0ABV9H4W1_9HYPH
MLDVGWSEILVIAIVMIVVVGPRDLPKMLRAFGKATARMRATANEFRQHFDQAMREAELDDVKNIIDEARSLDPRSKLTEVFDPIRSVGEDLRSSLHTTVASPQTPETVIQPVDKVETPAPVAAVAETAVQTQENAEASPRKSTKAGKATKTAGKAAHPDSGEASAPAKTARATSKSASGEKPKKTVAAKTGAAAKTTVKTKQPKKASTKRTGTEA